MNWMVLPNQVCLIVKLYNNRPGLLPDSNVITEEMKKTLPVLTDEEFKRIRCPKEELIEGAVNEFNRRADEIDALYD